MGFPLSILEHFLLSWEQDGVLFCLSSRREHLMAPVYKRAFRWLEGWSPSSGPVPPAPLRLFSICTVIALRPGACSSPTHPKPSNHQWLSLPSAWRGTETISHLRNVRNGTSWPPPCPRLKGILSFLTTASFSLGITPTQWSQAPAAFAWGEGWKGEELMKEQEFAFPQSQSNSLVADSTSFSEIQEEVILKSCQ